MSIPLLRIEIPIATSELPRVLEILDSIASRWCGKRDRAAGVDDEIWYFPFPRTLRLGSSYTEEPVLECYHVESRGIYRLFGEDARPGIDEGARNRLLYCILAIAQQIAKLLRRPVSLGNSDHQFFSVHPEGELEYHILDSQEGIIFLHSNCEYDVGWFEDPETEKLFGNRRAVGSAPLTSEVSVSWNLKGVARDVVLELTNGWVLRLHDSLVTGGFLEGERRSKTPGWNASYVRHQFAEVLPFLQELWSLPAASELKRHVPREGQWIRLPGVSSRERWATPLAEQWLHLAPIQFSCGREVILYRIGAGSNPPVFMLFLSIVKEGAVE